MKTSIAMDHLNQNPFWGEVNIISRFRPRKPPHSIQVEAFRREEKRNSLSKNENSDDSFIFAVSPVVTFFQCLALIPVSGVSQSDPKALHFKWKTFRVVLTLVYISYGICVSAFFFANIASLGISAKNIVGFVFFFYVTICVIIFFHIAMNWRELMIVWAEKEKRFLSYPYKVLGFKLSTKIRFTAMTVTILAFTEHLLFLSNNGYNHYYTVKKCNWTIESPLGYFFEHQFDFLFKQIGFNLPMGIFVELLNVSFTFGWNYMEIFVMIVSLGIVTRFWQINNRLDGLKGKVLPESVWIEVREDYVIICELMERVDHDLRYLILMSNLNNVYFICFQLLNIYDSLPHLINYVYFWFSLVYLFGRTLSAQYLAALIHDASNYPLEVLKRVPYEGWCIEVQRFIDQIRAQTMAFSGCKFFYLTRKSILAMLTTIVTYELVLLQFDTNSKEQVDSFLNLDECSENPI